MTKMQKWSLEYRDINHNKNYENLKKTEDRFKFTKEVKNMIDTYGFCYTSKKPKVGFLVYNE